MTDRAFRGIWIPKEIWETDLSAVECVVFAEIDSLDGEHGCFATNEYLANKCKVSVATIKRAIKTLQDAGYISVDYSPSRVIRSLMVVTFGVAQWSHENEAPCEPADQNDPGVAQNEPHRIQIREQIKESTLTSTRESARFVPPTIDEVRQYVREKNLNVDPQRFIDYFEAGNWHDSEGKPVKAWKQKLITWSNKSRPEPAKKPLSYEIDQSKREEYKRVFGHYPEEEDMG